MWIPSSPSIVVYTVAELKSKTVAELKAICDYRNITYATNDVKNKLVALIVKDEGISYTSSDLESNTTAELKAICDGLGIAYTDSNTDDELKALILA